MTDRRPPARPAFRTAVVSMVLPLCSLAAMGVARADGPIGLYFGAAYGQAHIQAQLDGLSGSQGPLGPMGQFDGTDSAFQGMLGIRLLSFLGAEVTYMDFGQRSLQFLGEPVTFGTLGAIVTAQQVSQKGEAAFAMLYLPVPVIDVYVKAGLSRITTNMTATYVDGGLPQICGDSQPNCSLHDAGRSLTDVGFAYGAGLQWKLGDWAVRGEYERFSAAGANPTLFSIGMTYWLL